MGFARFKKIGITFIKISNILLVFLIIYLIKSSNAIANQPHSKEDAAKAIEQIIHVRNKAIITRDLEVLESIYDTKTKYGRWAYEYEKIRIKYINNWEQKQGIKFIDIDPKVVIKTIKENGDRYSINLMCSIAYKYVYENEPNVINVFKTGSHHVITVMNEDGEWIITKEWYMDPFGDALSLENLKVDSIKEFILSQEKRDFSSINERRIGAIEYAERYCGAASDEKYGYSYNKKYRSYNNMGGDCTNFASQILHEGGKFRKTSAWNYDGSGATRAWVNADGFKSYMLYSGRASVIAYGNYEKVFKASYKLLPGDFIAYEEKGDIEHIAVVTGADSKGYTLVSCHTSDRNKVPWDLGWSGKGVRFWLIRVHY